MKTISALPAWKLALIAALPVALLVFLLSSWAFRAPESRPAPRPAGPVSLAVAPPKAVAESFLTLLRLHDLAGARELLANSRKNALPFEDFKKQAESWLEDDANHWDLQYRHAGPSSVGGRQAYVTVLGKGANWTWVMVKEETGWKLADLGACLQQDQR